MSVAWCHFAADASSVAGSVEIAGVCDGYLWGHGFVLFQTKLLLSTTGHGELEDQK